MDVSRYARFERPGHAVTGDRSQRSRNWMRPETRVGYDYDESIATGGTISMGADAAAGGVVPQLTGHEILRHVPGWDRV